LICPCVARRRARGVRNAIDMFGFIYYLERYYF